MEQEAVVRIYCAGRKGIHTGFLKNLSTGGMFLHIVEPEPPGTRLHFELRLDPKRPEVVTGSGEVAFRREVYGGPGKPPGMGVRFLALTPEGAAVLATRLGEPPRAAITDPDGLSGLPTEVAPGAQREPGPTFPAEAPAAAGTPASPGVPGTRNEEATDGGASWWLPPEPARGRPSRTAILAGTALLLAVAGGLLWFRTGPSDLREPEARTAIAPTSPLRSPDPTAPGARAAGEAADRPEGVVVGSPSVPDDPEPGPLSRIEAIRWEEGPGSLVVVVEGDGLFEPGRATYSHIGGDSPRGVVRIRDVERATDRYREDLPSDLVATIRTGYHEGAGGRGDLHLVLDLRDPAARITGVLPAGTELLVYVGRS